MPHTVRNIAGTGYARIELSLPDENSLRSQKLGEFSVAGKDRNWHWADAKIEGDSVIISSAEVADPVAARYAWQANPLATLYNGAGLPAVPFRTDDWPESTQH